MAEVKYTWMASPNLLNEIGYSFAPSGADRQRDDRWSTGRPKRALEAAGGEVGPPDFRSEAGTEPNVPLPTGVVRIL